MGFAQGLIEGLTEGIQKNQERSVETNKLKYTADKQQALEILKAIMEGNIKPADIGETPTITLPGEGVAPKGIGDTLMQGFGLRKPQMTQGQGYVAQSNLDRQLKEAEIAEKTARTKNLQNINPEQAIVDENGNIIGYRPRGAVFQPKGTEVNISAADVNAMKPPITLPFMGDREAIARYKQAQQGLGKEVINKLTGKQATKNYVKTGIDQATGKRVGMLADGTIEEIQ
jgi:hypothetical protein